MRVLIGNQVKTPHANHHFADREQAEAFVMSLRLRDRTTRRPPVTAPAAARQGATKD